MAAAFQRHMDSSKLPGVSSHLRPKACAFPLSRLVTAKERMNDRGLFPVWRTPQPSYCMRLTRKLDHEGEAAMVARLTTVHKNISNEKTRT